MDLQYKGLCILQTPQCAFNADAVLLAGFARAKPGARAVDLGAGTGVIALLCGARTSANFACIEIQPEACDLMRRTFAQNNVPYPVYCLDWADAHEVLGFGGFSMAVCNPPYFDERVTKSPNPNRAAARIQSGPDALSGAARAANLLLKNGGDFFISYPATRLADAFVALREAGLPPKELRLVAARPDKAPYLALIRAKKGANPGLLLSPVLFLKDANGEDTPEIRRIYHMDGEKE